MKVSTNYCAGFLPKAMAGFPKSIAFWDAKKVKCRRVPKGTQV
jgi:hypothetical protein